MPRKLITVTAADIETGRRLCGPERGAPRSQSCPIAQALKSAGYLMPSVGPNSIAFRSKEDGLWSEPILFCNSKLKEFIRMFDEGLSVEPFKFYLNY